MIYFVAAVCELMSEVQSVRLAGFRVRVGLWAYCMGGALCMWQRTWSSAAPTA